MRNSSLVIWFVAVVLSLMARLNFAADWPQWLGADRNSVWEETGIVDKFPEEGPKVVWRTPIAGGYSGPAVVGGKVYAMDFTPSSGNSRLDFNNRDRMKG